MNELISKVKNSLSELNFLIKSKNRYVDIEIDDIPTDWTYIENSKSIKWKYIPTLSGAIYGTACLYYGSKGSQIDAHKHIEQNELLSVENTDGHILVITKEYEKELFFGDSIKFDKDEPHIIIFKSDSILLCRWKPPFMANSYNETKLY